MIINEYNNNTKEYLDKIKANYINDILDNQNINFDLIPRANFDTKTIKDKNGNNTNLCLWKFTKQLNKASKTIYIYIIEYIGYKKDTYKFFKIVKG